MTPRASWRWAGRSGREPECLGSGAQALPVLAVPWQIEEEDQA
jgi:hypothetical protein